VSIRWIAGFALVMWLAFGLVLTLQPVVPAPGQVIGHNAVPLRTLAIYLDNLNSPFWLGQFVGNLVMLLPLGLLGPIALPAMNGWIRVILAALAISLAIELAQLWIPNRSADVDDVLLNVAGAMLGYALFLLLRLGAGLRRTTPSTTEP
jgi:glycopeptide antibiotics resistance protein